MTTSDEKVAAAETQLRELDEEYKNLRTIYDDYRKKVDSLKEAEKRCLSAVSQQKYRLRQIADDLKNAQRMGTGQPERVSELLAEVAAQRGHFKDIEETLPRKISLYLKIVLGSVNVSLLSKMEKFAYKQDYEQFKFYVTIVTMVFSTLLYFFVNENRVLDAAFHFLLVWYYCTLTIREHILIANGSRIRGWWITHHFVSTACAGIVLIWPQSQSYRDFRNQLMLFGCYLSLIQLIQYNYQSGILYKLRALGGGHSLHITVDGFMSWMWRRLSFVLPFLFVGYLFQLYNAITLYRISRKAYCNEWQVLALAIIFFVLFLGNFSTVLQVIRQKLSKDGYTLNALHGRLTNKYRFNILRNERKDL